MTDIIHVLRESRSPPDAEIWEMWCGANCVAFSDGTLVPKLDFYHEKNADKATCEKCKARFKFAEEFLKEEPVAA